MSSQPPKTRNVPPIYRNPTRSRPRDEKLAALLRRIVQSAALGTAVASGGCPLTSLDATAGSGGSGGSGGAGGSTDDRSPLDAGDSTDTRESSADDAGGPVEDGGEESPMGTDAGFDAAVYGEPPLCSDDDRWLSAHGLEPVSTPTYIGTHTLSDSAIDGPQVNVTVRVGDAVGDACADASDVPSCEAALNDSTDLSLSECSMADCSRFLLVSTNGDDVQQYRTLAELLAFLGPIDTAQEAFLVARYHGYLPKCQGRTGSIEIEDGWELTLNNEGSCDGEFFVFTVRVTRQGVLTEVKRESLGLAPYVCGRRPNGMCDALLRGDDSELKHYLLECAQLEAGAVFAFENLALELLHHGAPRALVDWALASAAQEREHTDIAETLCARYGAEPARPSLETTTVRSLLALAEDNVIEGCVRETYGALLACYQAEHAADPALARAMQRIAGDEAQHAELAWALDAWLSTELNASQRARLGTLRREAIAELRAELSRTPDVTLRSRVGLPDTATAARLLDGLDAAVWQGTVECAA